MTHLAGISRVLETLFPNVIVYVNSGTYCRVGLKDGSSTYRQIVTFSVSSATGCDTLTDRGGSGGSMITLASALALLTLTIKETIKNRHKISTWTANQALSTKIIFQGHIPPLETE